MSDKDRNPEKFDQLSEADQKAYKDMQAAFSQTFYSKQRGRSFKEIFAKIKSFVDHDKIRGVVCGFFPVSNEKLLVNTRQLQILLGVCKSQTNNLLKKAGFLATLDRPHLEEVAEYLHISPQDPQAVQWSYRTIPQNQEDSENHPEVMFKTPKVPYDQDDPLKYPIFILEIEDKPVYDVQYVPNDDQPINLSELNSGAI